MDFDVVVIGGGPGGYVAAIRASQLGLKAACIEKRATLGGTCLNVGCIPSKALLQSSHHFEAAGHEFANHGIKIQGLELDLATLMGRKDKLVGDLTKGIDFLLKKNKVTRLNGAARITGKNQINVEGQVVTAKNIIIATGSEVTPLPGVEIDEKQIISSTGALALPQVPQSLIVVGAGVIGLELGSVWRRLGAKVTVVEFLDRILPPCDGEVASQLQKLLTKQGMEFRLGQKVVAAQKSADGVVLEIEAVNGGAKEELKAGVVLVAIGRRPYTEGLGLESLGIETTPRGFIKVNKHLQTSVANIYAIGDVIGGAMLAHKAEEEGVAAAETIAGKAGHVNYSAIPNVIYTWPEVAGVGETEEQLKARGVNYKVGKFPFMANSRAKANGDSEGFVKLLADAKTDRVLGAHMIGPYVSELIGEVVLGMEFATSAEDIARTSHAHPGLGEAVKEAALALDGRAIHI